MKFTIVAFQLDIVTDKDHYLPDEKLTGKIYLVTRESLRVSKLVAIVEGYNHVTWEEGKHS